MKRELILSGSLANAKGNYPGDELLNFLVGEMPDAEFYKFCPPPCKIVAAGLGWQAILGTTSSVLSIAQALWAAYKKFILPIKQINNNSNADLFIYIKTEENKSEQFMVGKSFKKEDEFLKGLKNRIKNLEQPDINEEKLAITKQELRTSKHWVRIKKTHNKSMH
jgi:hypothetical protein